MREFHCHCARLDSQVRKQKFDFVVRIKTKRVPIGKALTVRQWGIVPIFEMEHSKCKIQTKFQLYKESGHLIRLAVTMRSGHVRDRRKATNGWSSRILDLQ